MNPNIDKIADLLKVAEKTDLSEVHLTSPNGRVTVRRIRGLQAKPAPSVSAPAALKEKAAPQEPQPFTIKAPMVGFFRTKATPLAEGDILEPGDVVGFIESLTLMNEVTTQEGGKVAELLVEAGAAVQYGQPLVILEPVLEAELEAEPV